MSRLIFVPQYPAPMRYQSWFIVEFEKQFKKYFDEVIILGKEYVEQQNVMYGNNFSPLKLSIEYESRQICEYMNLELFEDDILFLADLSFPGLFTNVLYHKKPSKCFAYCHGTSKNNYDYFQSVRKSKWKVECGHSQLFDRVFVATQYHKEKLGWGNIEVIGLPVPPILRLQKDQKYNYINQLKDICSVSRPSQQKVNKKLEKFVESKFGKINRSVFSLWCAYYSYLSTTKVLLITSNEETFGYQILDAILSDCTPIAPNKFSYPELLPKEYLYNNKDELINIIEKVLSGKLKCPDQLLCQDMVDNFYENLCNSFLNG